MKKYTIGNRLRYAFDNTMSRGSYAMIAWLGFFSAFIILFAAFIIVLFEIFPESEGPLSFIEAFWKSLMRTLDPGTMGEDKGWGFRIVQFLVTLGGIFIISTLIGVISSGIESLLSGLRKGRSLIIENNHTLILGWSPKIFTIVSELVNANENQKRPRVVILAEKDKIEMEDEIKDNIPDLKNTKVICRSGNPNDLIDIEIVNPQNSKSIIILTKEDDTADSQTIKTILAITNNTSRRNTPYHIVAEIRDEKNFEIAKMIGNDEIELILTDDIIGRIVTQTSRQAGLSIIYTDIMNFSGDEIYFSEEPSLAGKRYYDALFAYKDSAVMGIQKKNGSVYINPDKNLIIEEGDKIIAITEDDDTLIADKDGGKSIDHDAIINDDKEIRSPEKILLFGWNKRAFSIIKEIDNYSLNKSILKIVSAYEIKKDMIKKISDSVKNIKVEYLFADTTNKDVINSLNITSFNHVIILSYKSELPIQEADACTLVTLLHLRNTAEKSGKDINIVSEMLDKHNRELADVTKADDFIVSNHLISLLMTQVAENKHLMKVFEILLDSEGSEIYIKPADRYVKANMPVNFYTVAESAIQKGETAIGYRICNHASDSKNNYGIVLNPIKSDTVKYTERDKIIVISED